MSARRIERVLLATGGGEVMPVLRALERSGREGVPVMRDSDGARAWIDELEYTVYVPAGAEGRWPDWFKLASAAMDAGCDALLPGLDALAGNGRLAERCGSMNLAYLGPSPAQLDLAADIAAFLERGQRLSIRTLPVLALPADRAEARAEARSFLERWGFPARLRRVYADGALDTVALTDLAQADAAISASGDGERLVLLHLPPHARTVEIPILGDGQGLTVTVGDREVTVWRGLDGVLVEAPAADLPEGLRAQLAEDALRLVADLGWRGAGAVLFSVTADGRPFLRELRAGLSPWYAATEAAYGVDLVDALTRVAEGDALGWDPGQIVPVGAAMLLRLYVERAAEDAPPALQGPPEDGDEDGDDPLTGIAVTWVSLPDDVTLDLALTEGDRVQVGDLLGPILIEAPTRQSCIVRAKTALDHVDIGGIVHTGAVLSEVLSEPRYWRGPDGGEP